MPITVKCPACEKTLKTKDELAGRKGKCPDCGHIMVIPGKPSVPQAPQPEMGLEEMPERASPDAAEMPRDKQAVKTVRIFGGINAGGDQFPLTAAGRIARGLGLIVVALVWGSAILNGVGLLLLSHWGRKLAIVWGRAIAWVLPIAFGLASRSLSSLVER